MTPQERQLLSALVERIQGAPPTDRDAEADQVIRELTLARPDTTYLLAQTVLMQDFGLRNAQAQIAELQRQLQAAQAHPKSSGGFLSGLFGGGAASGTLPMGGSVPPAGPWAQPAPPPYPQPVAAPAYAPVVMQPSQTSGFLRSAATTAAGIAGGALLFEGIQSLFSGHGPGYGGGFMNQGGGWGGGDGGFGPRESLSETTIVNNNNYYDQSATPQDPSADVQPDQGYDQPDQGYQDTADTDPSSGDDGFSSGDSGGGDWT